MSHVAIQVQSQGAHGKSLKALHSTWNLSVCLLIQAHEAQDIASIAHLVHNTWGKHRGREGDVDGPVVPSRDDHLLGADLIYVAGRHTIVPLQDDRDDLLFDPGATTVAAQRGGSVARH